MHPFSIDFITRETSDDNSLAYNHCESQETQNRNHGNVENFRQTPSPTDSGMESDHSSTHSPHGGKLSVTETLLALDKKAPRTGKAGDSEKPSHSYIALISMAILSSSDQKMLLCDIYQHIMENFAYYNNEEKAWRNSIRHNLSLNECFIKNGRADNGKGNYWSIHPACVDDFAKGDFRRRQARRRARKSVKDCNTGDMSSPYHRYNVGYVPMTPSHIGYHPYGPANSSLYYPQSSVGVYSSIPQTLSSSTASLSSNSPLVSGYSQQNLPGYFPSCSTSPTTQSTSALSAAVAQRLFSEQTTAVLSAQSFAPQHISSSFQLQNWCQENI